jgi:hypothetical protein
MNDEDRNDSLIASAGKLATEISPERDLWPGIAKSIAQPRRSRWTPMLAQAAAVVVLIGASSGVTFMAMKDNQQPVQIATPELFVEQASFGGSNALGPEYLEIRGDIVAQLEEDLVRLSPETRADVEKNLQVIRSAIAEINTALEAEPTNTLLQDLLLRTYQDELAVMHRVGGVTQRVMSRKDI